MTGNAHGHDHGSRHDHEVPGVATRWRVRAGVAAALVATVGVVALPTPSRSIGAAASAVTPPGAPAGPPTLTGTWPAAAVRTMAAVLPDGSTYRPELVLDATTSVGTAGSADGVRFQLVVVGAGGVRVLQSGSMVDGVAYDGVVASAERLYWMRTTSGPDGRAVFGLWEAARSGGPAREVTSDVGVLRFDGSHGEVQIVDGALVWTSAGGSAGERTELRSLPLAGGRVTKRTIAGDWVPAGWPWLTTASGAAQTQVELYNLDTGARTPVLAPADKEVTCSPTWCRLMSASGGPASVETDLIRPDGSDLRRIGDRSMVSALQDVALRDRFEVLLVPNQAATAAAVSLLSVYDIAANRTVRIDPAVADVGTDGTFLWWSTGDNETLTWHILDLTTLT
jgi:hypothetical protein